MHTSPQAGIFALGTGSHAYLEFDVAAQADPVATCALVAGLREPRTTIGGVNLVAGFRPELWALAGARRRPRRARAASTSRSSAPTATRSRRPSTTSSSG